MVLFKCDRCKKVNDSYEFMYQINYPLMSDSNEDGSHPYRMVDLCYECAGELNMFMAGDIFVETRRIPFDAMLKLSDEVSPD